MSATKKILLGFLFTLTACTGSPGTEDVQLGNQQDSVAKTVYCSNALAGSVPLVEVTCRDCALEGEAFAYDGDTTTFAVLSLKATPAGTVHDLASVVFTAPAGLSFPAGQHVGALMRLASSGLPIQQSLNILTYLTGTPQEFFRYGNDISGAYGASDAEYAQPASLAYDAIGLLIDLNTVDGEAKEIRIYELCT